MSKEKYIAALDVGTTTIRCIIYNSKVEIISTASDQVELLYPQPGYVEINPDKFWSSTISTIENAIRMANLETSDISCIGISTQRSTFITWDRVTGEYFHNFITWKDLRADELVKKWNSSYIMKTFRAISHSLYLCTRSKRFLAGSVLKLMNTQTTLRLTWVIQHNEKLQKAIADKTAMFGTLDSWLLYKLRQGDCNSGYIEHICDVTNATATGFYDPFTMSWAAWALSLFSIKEDMLPKVVDNSYDFGIIHKSHLGAEIVIGSSMGDQSASMWGSCCFNKGDVKVTLGTGSFLNVNTGSQCHASIHGLYPLVAWCTKSLKQKEEELFYCVEGASNDTGSIIKWAINFGLFTDPHESSDIAYSVKDSDGVYFVPAFSGLGLAGSVYWKKRSKYYWNKKAPINDHQAATGILGLRPSTSNAHLVRAVLESIAYRVAQLYLCTLKETNFKFSLIRVDGGVSKNDFICQLLADLTGLQVERSENSELSALGVGFLAGLNAKIWRSKDELIRLRKIDKIFEPRPEIKELCIAKMASWERAVDRFKGWYNAKELPDITTSDYDKF